MSSLVRAAAAALAGFTVAGACSVAVGCSSSSSAARAADTRGPDSSDGPGLPIAVPATTDGGSGTVGSDAPLPGAKDAGSGDASDAFDASTLPVKNLSALGAKCDGSDDTLAVIAAVTGARNDAYTLVVDCPATLDIGLNIDRSIILDNGTSIAFTSSGKFTINNLFEPAFLIANSSNITLTNWNVEWKGSMPVSLDTDGYSQGGVYHSTPGANGSGQFNDVVLSQWLTKNRGVTFADGPSNGRWAWWIGSVNVGAVFLIIGESSNVHVSGLDLYSANTAEPSDYVPFAVEFGLQYRSNQTITTATPDSSAANAGQFFAAPTGVSFDDVTFDGVIMGFQGNTIDSTFSNLTVKHVSDLQDADGGNVGGVGQSFPPPHLFYLNYPFGGDPALANSGIKISNVNEVGPRTGLVRPGGGGYADSLKLGCNDCSVDGYTTNRKDGFMDVLDSDGLTVSNVTATYDSSFVDEYEDWPGWRWPGGGTDVYFKNVSFSHVSLTDVAAASVAGPLGNNTSTQNGDITMSDVNITVQSWTKGNILPTWTGLSAGSAVTFTLKAQDQTQTLKP